jgi:hypothetical protein
MNKDFNVYKWRRNYLAENEASTPKDLLNKFKEKIRGAFLRDEYIETEDRSVSGEEEKVRKIFSDHGYTLSKVERIEGEPGERLDMIRYYYTK